MLGQVKDPNSDPIGGIVSDTIFEILSGGGTAQTQSLRDYQAVVPPSGRVSSDGTISLGGGTAQC